MEATAISVIIVDDYQVVRDGIKAVLIPHKNIKVVAEASNEQELYKYLSQIKADVIVLDISLPSSNGIDITRKLSKDYPEVKVIIFSAKTDEETIFDALDAGAKAFLPKDTFADEIPEAIIEVSQGNDYLSVNFPNTLLVKYIKRDKYNERYKEQDFNKLTKREYEILKLIAEGYSSKEIASQLFLSPRTVDTHRTNIMNKLQLYSLQDLIKYAIKNKIIKL